MKTSSSTYFVPVWFLALALLVPSPGSSLTYAMVADEIMADQADVIAEVRVLEVDPSPGIGRPVTDYLMAVERVIHGEVAASPLTVRVLGGILADGIGLHIYGAPRFVAEQRALLFLKHRPDGTYRILHFVLGAFHLVEHDGKSFALRRLSEAKEIALPGRVPPRDGPRDLERFRAWLEDRAQGNTRGGDYFVEDGEEIAGTFEKFTILTELGQKIRWPGFSGNVDFRAHVDGQPGVSGGGFSQVSTAVAAWRNDANSDVRYVYPGTTSATGGLTNYDGVNAFLFADPNNNPDFEDAFSCSGGESVIAIGGPWFDPDVRHVHNGEIFITALKGDVVTNKGLDCLSGGQPWIGQQKRAEEIFAHELGHTLGLGHSGNSGALMWPYAHGENFGATLKADDRAGIRFLYGEPLFPPSAPGGLSATAISTTRIDLSWNDNSSDETEFRVERRIGGGNYGQIASLGANVTSYQDNSAQAGTTYTYRVRAVNDAGPSGFSNTATASTFGETAPSDLSAFAVSDSAIQLSWTDNSMTETGFEIEGKTGGAPFSLIQTVAADTESVTISGLNPVTSYTYRVRAVGAAGISAYSNEAGTITFFSDPDPCVAGATTLCLSDGRFKVEVTWTDFIDQTGPGTDLGLASTDSGLFYFFSPNNWEMLVKMIDACDTETQHFWVFAAATTNVAYDLVVTDSVSGFSRTYSNALGVSSPAIIDTSAFATCLAEMPEPSPPATAPPAAARLAGKGGCVASDTRFCFNGERYAVELEWRNFASGTGFGRVDPFQSGDSGLFYFVDPQNLEVLVKVLNGCPFNDRVWVFAAATTNFEYTLRVTDTVTDVTREYFNELGNAADAITDTEAFDSCP